HALVEPIPAAISSLSSSSHTCYFLPAQFPSKTRVKILSLIENSRRSSPWRHTNRHRSASLLHLTPMAPPQPGGSDRRPPPLGLRGLSRVAFQPRSPPPGAVPPPPPLGLTGRASMPAFSIGTTRSEPHPPPTTLPRRRVGLARPSRPPAPNEAGSSNWSVSIGGAVAGSGEMVRSSFVGFSLVNGGGGISFGSGGSESMGFTFSSGTGGIRIRDGSSRELGSALLEKMGRR
uniref:Uncharacterized protein n=1 Tax=Aegilops tauschii subsp. strangulata TaxID=200361 RepID=A0A452Y206_AEGTS